MIYISCPVHQYTGGPTLAHQLCKILNEQNMESMMFYVDNNKKCDDPVHPNYKIFGNPFVTQLSKETTDVLIILETKSSLLLQFPNAKKYMWWQSVDNFFISHFSYYKRLIKWLGYYPISIKKEIKNFKKNYPEIYNDSSIIHLVQSEYAREFLQSIGVDNSRIISLTDYIEDEVIIKSKEERAIKRRNIVLYNPRKGYKFTKRIIQASKKRNFEFVPLVNMNKDEVIYNLCNSKLYIDFGNHPGKDRFPREAAICGCCIMTGRRGAANNCIDISIDDKYKIEDKNNNIPLIVDTIESIVNDYDERIKDFKVYRDKILGEKKQFENEAKAIFGSK